MTASHQTEVKYLVLGADCAFDDGIMDWDYVVTYAWSWMKDCRVIEVVVITLPSGEHRFTFGRDITDEAIAAYEREQSAPSTNLKQIAEHGTYHRGIGI